MEAKDLGSLTKYGFGSSAGIPTCGRHVEKGSSLFKNALNPLIFEGSNDPSESVEFQPAAFKDAAVWPTVGAVTLPMEKRDPLTLGRSDEPLPFYR